MSRVTVKWNGGEWLAKLRVAVDDGLGAAAWVAARHAVRSMSKPGPSAPGAYPGTDTGLGRASVVAVHPRELGTPGRAAYGSNVAYMRKQEFGGIIRAKGKRYLTVPLNREAKLLRRRTPDLRSVPGLVIVKGLLGRKGPGGRFVPLFALKRQVRLPPRPWALRCGLESATAMKEAFVKVVRDGLAPVKEGV